MFKVKLLQYTYRLQGLSNEWQKCTLRNLKGSLAFSHKSSKIMWFPWYLRWWSGYSRLGRCEILKKVSIRNQMFSKWEFNSVDKHPKFLYLAERRGAAIMDQFWCETICYLRGQWWTKCWRSRWHKQWWRQERSWWPPEIGPVT